MSTITNVPITPDMYAQRQIRVLVMKEEVEYKMQASEIETLEEQIKLDQARLDGMKEYNAARLEGIEKLKALVTDLH
jgi:hypothetical protein